MQYFWPTYMHVPQDIRGPIEQAFRDRPESAGAIGTRLIGDYLVSYHVHETKSHVALNIQAQCPLMFYHGTYPTDRHRWCEHRRYCALVYDGSRRSYPSVIPHADLLATIG